MLRDVAAKGSTCPEGYQMAFIANLTIPSRCLPLSFEVAEHACMGDRYRMRIDVLKVILARMKMNQCQCCLNDEGCEYDDYVLLEDRAGWIVVHTWIIYVKMVKF